VDSGKDAADTSAGNNPQWINASTAREMMGFGRRSAFMRLWVVYLFARTMGKFAADNVERIEEKAGSQPDDTSVTI
jgi:hypothetical protein